MEDLDSNGQNDLALTYYYQQKAGEGAGSFLSGAAAGSSDKVTVLWDGGVEVTDLEARWVKALTAGDFDGDGSKDLALAIHQSEKEFATESWIYYGKGDRNFERSVKGFPTSGAYDITTVPSENGKPDRSYWFFSNGQSLTSFFVAQFTYAFLS